MKNPALKEKEKVHKLARKKESLVVSFLPLLFIMCSVIIFPYASYGNAENKDLDTVKEIELKIFKQDFSSLPITERISMIEEFTFGNSTEKTDLTKRIDKIFKAYNYKKVVDNSEISFPEVKTVEPSQKKIEYVQKYDNSIIGSISQLEEKVFQKTYPEMPFPQRIETLENKILTRTEKAKNKDKTILERVTFLLNKAKINTNNNSQTATQEQTNSDSYTVDKKTGFLINKRTNEYLLDNTGNPVSINRQNQNTGLEQFLGGELDPSNPITQLLLQKQYENKTNNTNLYPQLNYPTPKYPQNPYQNGLQNGIPQELLQQFQNGGSFQDDLEY